MYTPNSYKNEDFKEIKSFITKNSFGILINQNNGKLTGTHIPLVLDINKNGENILTGHISKVNPQWKNFNDDDEVLVIFSGPHSYISSSWYEQENVPTWNYIAVHIYGSIKIIEGEELLNSLKKLVNKYEKGSENPIRIETMSEKNLKQINGIIGFNIKINDIQATYKLSQNRKEPDYDTIIHKLENTTSPNSIEIAKQMKKRRK
ncbi:MAG: FMN-binding negative transcriptional regulator [Lutibacter sp.]|uniref:FMN-binding negative transcriptional regulator n=1 Tax=Lutibacter sp. TaxID=1925666 RepID=UPI00385DF445